mmetsp:Transcript_28447/g.62595  ORF Transcript_28447/g.62595 Transcript_28447/m.62595 type:complete len:200 (-) Transcript_28447:1429-2028(-)
MLWAHPPKGWPGRRVAGSQQQEHARNSSYACQRSRADLSLPGLPDVKMLHSCCSSSSHSSAEGSTLLSPKSMNQTLPSSPTRMFSARMSPCATPRAWMALSACSAGASRCAAAPCLPAAPGCSPRITDMASTYTRPSCQNPQPCRAGTYTSWRLLRRPESTVASCCRSLTRCGELQVSAHLTATGCPNSRPRLTMPHAP